MGAERQLIELATSAIDAPSPEETKSLLGLLFAQASASAIRVEPIEGTADPVQIARAVLGFTLFDWRVEIEGIPVQDIDPNDATSQLLRTRQVRMPGALCMLDIIVSA